MAALGAGVQVDGVVVDAGRGVAGDLGAFGGVLGPISGNHRVRNRIATAHGDDADIGLGALFDEPAARLCRVRVCGAADGGGGLADGVVQVGSGDPGRGWDERIQVVRVNAVGAEQGVEVDGSAGLEFG